MKASLIALAVSCVGMPLGQALRPRWPVVFDQAVMEETRVLTRAPGPLSPIPVSPQIQDQVKAMLSEHLDVSKTKAWLTRFTGFPERYYKSQNGIEAAHWIRDQVLALADSPLMGRGVRLSVRLFEHSWKMQPSVIARLEPVEGAGTQDIVVTGAHLDTIACKKFPWGETIINIIIIIVN